MAHRLTPDRPTPLELLLGPAGVGSITGDEMRWEDDGGPARHAQDGYEHIWSPVRFAWLDDELIAR